jgi:PTH1 family peptidyl-tRNA hydrolase
MFLIVGLGNPGKDYAGNRHNIGFMAVDEITNDYGFSKPAKKFGGSLCEGMIGGTKTIAFRPLGYMNTSGGPAAQVASFYRIAPNHIIVIHDEIDLPLGRLKVKIGGGHGGHNGLKSMDSHVGKEYKRVRVGVDRPADPDDVADYVLKDFKKAEWPVVETMCSEISKHIGLLLKGDDAGFMNKISLTMKDEA